MFVLKPTVDADKPEVGINRFRFVSIIACFRLPARRLVLEAATKARKSGGADEGRADEVMDRTSKDETNE